MIELKKEQITLSKKVKTTNEFPEVHYIGGTDQVAIDGNIIAVISILTFPKLEEVEKKYAIIKQETHYNPGYLYYQEGPAILEAYNKLKQQPDILLVKGDGILHPRRIGLASQLGIALNIPTIGIAKSILCGELKNETVIVAGEARAKLLVTKKQGNPLFISPGHRIDLNTAYNITKDCVVPPHKMPEPIAISHKLILKLKQFQREKKEI